MKEEGYFLSLDLGTSTLKAAIYDTSFNLVSIATAETISYHPKPTWMEQDPDEWWSSTISVIHTVFDKSEVSPEEVLAVGTCGQCHGPTFVDKDCKPLHNCIVWPDLRSVESARDVRREMGVNVDDHAALNPYYTAGKLRWIRDNRPDLIDKAYKFLMPKDFIRAKLSNCFVTDIRDCGGTQMLDIKTRSWDLKFVDCVGIPRRLLPDVFPSQSIVGEITEKSAKETDLKPGTPVIAGSGDGSIEPVISGMDLKETILVYLGTAPILLAPVNKPVWKRLFALASLLFSRSRALPMGWPIRPHYIGGVLAAEGGILLKWFKEEFGSFEENLSRKLGTSPYVLLDQEISKVPVGSEGLLFLPHMMGERSHLGKMNPYAKGVVYGLSLGHTREHFLRAAMEGIAFQLRTVLDSLRLEHSEISATSIVVFGGGAKSKIWRQIISDVFGLPVRLLGQEETATLNVACLLSVALGMYKDVVKALINWKTEVISEEIPNPEAQEKYNRLYRLYRRLDEALTDSYSFTSQLRDFYG